MVRIAVSSNATVKMDNYNVNAEFYAQRQAPPRGPLLNFAYEKFKTQSL